MDLKHSIWPYMNRMFFLTEDERIAYSDVEPMYVAMIFALNEVAMIVFLRTCNVTCVYSNVCNNQFRLFSVPRSVHRADAKGLEMQKCVYAV